MVPAIKAFADSSLLIEYIKGNQTELLDYVVKFNPDLCINSIVVSEFLFHVLAYKGGKSPLTLKVNQKIAEVLSAMEIATFLQPFTFLPDAQHTVTQVPELMKKYNLLPNDATILAACIANQLRYLISFDSDFAAPCQAEGIVWISRLEEAKAIFL